jgi:serine/threonine protein kinase
VENTHEYGLKAMADVGCVTDVDLRALLLGDLPEPVAQAITRHLESCPVCEAAAEKLDRTTDPFMRLMRQAIQPSSDNASAVTSISEGAAPKETAQFADPDSNGRDGPPGYAILEELGRGGMSVVYRARQRRPERVVALKVLLSGGHASTQRRLRFLAEADAIARLQHPNIVQVYEVGEHNGLPFLVLEFMRGGSLAKELAGRPLPARQAAELCEVLARAVEHAHSQGVVHRDLKPANILLSAEHSVLSAESKDRVAVLSGVKISDFGLAKQERPDLTATGEVLGTPSYMAPEQAHGAGREAGPAADIHALGAMLYEFLTGRPPFLGASVLQTLEQVRGQEPVPPSRLQPHVPRDLETICLKCLQKEQGKRYASALCLAEDLRHFLTGEPILARPVSSVEKIWRWSKRKPLVASLMATLALTLIGSVLALTGLYLKADTQRQRAEGAEERWQQAAANARAGEAKAQRSEAETKAVLEFFQKRVISAAAPKGLHGGLGPEVTIRAAMDQAEPTIAKSFEDQPLAEASIRQVLGHTYHFAGLYPRAIAQHQRALTLRRTHLGTEHPETLKSMVSLAQDYDTEGLRAEALTLYEETFRLCESCLGPDDSETLWAMRGVANGLQSAGRMTEALPLYEQALKRAKAALGSDHLDTLMYMSSLAKAYRIAGRLAEAIPLFQETLKLETVKLGPDHKETLDTMNQLAIAQLNAGQFAESAALLRETSKRMKAALGPDHPGTLNAMNNLAIVYREDGRPIEAARLLEETLKLKRAKLSPDNDDTLLTMGNLANAYRDMDRLSDALSLYKETLNLQKAKLGADYPSRVWFMNEAATCLLKMKRFDEAETVVRECLALRMRTDSSDWWIAQTKSQLGQTLTGRKRYAEAEELLLKAQKDLVACKDKMPGRFHRYIDEAGQALADLYDAWGKKEQAAEWRRRRTVSEAPR